MTKADKQMAVVLILTALLLLGTCVYGAKQQQQCEEKGGVYLWREHACVAGIQLK